MENWKWETKSRSLRNSEQQANPQINVYYKKFSFHFSKVTEAKYFNHENTCLIFQAYSCSEISCKKVSLKHE